MNYPGLIIFLPVPVPPLPEPYLSGNAAAIWAYTHNPANAGGNMEDFQKILNNEAVLIGNRAANTAVIMHNSQLIRYWQNGGPSNTYGLTLPSALADLAQYFKPAQDATAQFNVLTKKWEPVGPPLATPPWVLPAGTVLFRQLP